MANRLIRYEARLFRRSLADGFRGPADIALLVLVAIIGIAWLRDRAESAHALAVPPGALWGALLAGPVGFTMQRLAGQRLAWFAEHSPLAPDALGAKGRRTYLGTAHLVAALPVLAAASLLGASLGGPAAMLIATAAYGAGGALAFLVPTGRRRGVPARRDRPARDPGRGGRAVFALVLRRQTSGASNGSVPAALLVTGNFALTLVAGWWGASQPEALRVALMLLPSMVVLLACSRLDPAMFGFLPYAGYSPAFIAAVVSALPAASLAASALAVVLTGPVANAGVLLILGLIHLGFILAGIARAWLYPGRQPRSVDLQLQFEGAGLLTVAFLLPPLAIAAAGWRLWRFRQHCCGLRWTQP